MRYAAQVEVARSLRDGLAITQQIGGRSTGNDDVTLSSSLPTVGLPVVVDTMKTVWPRNPFERLPGSELGLGGVLEFTMRDGASGSEVPLPVTPPSTGTALASVRMMPVHFLVPVGTAACTRTGGKLQ
jgi:hypothetical protein